MRGGAKVHACAEEEERRAGLSGRAGELEASRCAVQARGEGGKPGATCRGDVEDDRKQGVYVRWWSTRKTDACRFVGPTNVGSRKESVGPTIV